jgi:hypothetical protein
MNRRERLRPWWPAIGFFALMIGPVYWGVALIPDGDPSDIRMILFVPVLALTVWGMWRLHPDERKEREERKQNAC